MSLRIDFNNRKILEGYLDQALSQVGLERVGIVVGKEGGLAYKLFEEMPISHHIRDKVSFDGSVEDIDRAQLYLSLVKGYLDEARMIANEHDFDLVGAGQNGIVPFNDSSYLMLAAIGDSEIRNQEHFEKFLSMLKEGQPSLKDRYSGIKEIVQQMIVKKD